MLNFKLVRCRIGKDSLKIRMKISKKKKEYEEEAEEK